MVELRLTPMTPAEFDQWKATRQKDYIEDIVKLGDWTREEATAKAEADFRGMATQGPGTAGHFFYTLEDPATGAHVGSLWFQADKKAEGARGRTVFILDLVVHESERGKGYGRKALALVEGRARELGFPSVSLHVFGHNQVAVGLYQRSGFETTNYMMSKRVPP